MLTIFPSEHLIIVPQKIGWSQAAWRAVPVLQRGWSSLVWDDPWLLVRAITFQLFSSFFLHSNSALECSYAWLKKASSKLSAHRKSARRNTSIPASWTVEMMGKAQSYAAFGCIILYHGTIMYHPNGHLNRICLDQTSTAQVPPPCPMVFTTSSESMMQPAQVPHTGLGFRFSPSAPGPVKTSLTTRSAKKPLETGMLQSQTKTCRVLSPKMLFYLYIYIYINSQKTRRLPLPPCTYARRFAMNLRKFLVLVCVSIGINRSKSDWSIPRSWSIGSSILEPLVKSRVLPFHPFLVEKKRSTPPSGIASDPDGFSRNHRRSLGIAGRMSKDPGVSGDLQASLGIFIGSLPPEISEGSGDSQGSLEISNNLQTVSGESLGIIWSFGMSRGSWETMSTVYIDLRRYPKKKRSMTFINTHLNNEIISLSSNGLHCVCV